MYIGRCKKSNSLFKIEFCLSRNKLSSLFEFEILTVNLIKHNTIHFFAIFQAVQYFFELFLTSDVLVY